MTTTFAPTHAGTAHRSHLVRTGAIAAVGAAVAATATAAIADAAGVRFVIGGDTIPIAGFAQLTIVFVAIGTALAAVLNRRAARPHHTFVITTLALTAISFVPDALAHAHPSTQLALMLTHVAAAAVAIPLLAGRLSD